MFDNLQSNVAIYMYNKSDQDENNLTLHNMLYSLGSGHLIPSNSSDSSLKR